MAKTATTATLSPFSIAPRAPVSEREVKTAIEMLNYAQCETTHTLFAFLSGADAYEVGSVAQHRVTFPATGSATPYGLFYVWVDPDVQTINLWARVTMTASNTGRVDITIGGATGQLTFAAGATTTQTTTLATSSTGTGWQACSIDTVKLTGTDAVAVFEAVSARSAVIAASNLADPDPTT